MAKPKLKLQVTTVDGVRIETAKDGNHRLVFESGVEDFAIHLNTERAEALLDLLKIADFKTEGARIARFPEPEQRELGLAEPKDKPPTTAAE